MESLICPNFPPELLARVRAEAKRMNVTMSFLVRGLIEKAFMELDDETENPRACASWRPGDMCTSQTAPKRDFFHCIGPKNYPVFREALAAKDKPPTEFSYVGVYKSYPCTKEQAEEAVAVFRAVADAKKDELLGREVEE